MNQIKIIISTEGLKQNEVRKVIEAKMHAEKVLNSDEFRQFCFEHKYTLTYTKRSWFKKRKYTRTYKGFCCSKGLSNIAVYNKIMSGREILNREVDHCANIYLKVDRRNKRGIVGYTYSNTKWQWIYSRILKKYTVEQVAGNIIHEWCHKLGFKHAYRWKKARRYSVPYSVGYYVARS